MVTSSATVWLLFAYRLPREPSTPRIAVWRRLKRLGAAQLGDGLVALPRDGRTQEQLEWLAGLVEEAGGSCTLWKSEVLCAEQEQAVVAQLVARRTAEYDSLLCRAEAALGSEGAERARILRLLRRELREVERRDYFPPEQRDVARAAVRALAVNTASTPPARAPR